ncbi:AsmA family protein [Thermomonas sp.]|uniref:AsmA family protein n=1 Tax=Thermomonas sp. TaxID=1971895 RepID=UPI0024880221|nr:AsmA family protein [Thermomonas sp.]MDI1251858.1 AsmA family protein [Thermomonas sp.]
MTTANSNLKSERSWLSRHPWSSVAILLAIGIFVLLLLWDWNWFKHPFERRVTAQTGREFHIDGNLDVDLGRTLTITAYGLRFGNTASAREPEMARTDRLEFDLRFWPLLRGKLQIPRIALDKPVLHLQRNPDGVANWVFPQSNSNLPEFRNVHIKEGLLTYFEPAHKTDLRINVDSLQPRANDAEPPISVNSGGRWNGNAFNLRGTAESPLELRDSARPYRIDIKAIAGPTRAHARGTLLDPLRFRDFDLQLALAGDNLGDLYPLIGVATPDTPPYALDGRLTRDFQDAKRSTWRYLGFSGKVGHSDLRGDAAVTIGGARPFFKGAFVSQRMNFGDLGGFIGKAPQARGSETNHPAVAAPTANGAASTRLLPSEPYKLDKLRAMDADVRLKARRIDTITLPIDDMDARLRIDDGVLRLDPLNFGVADGDLRAIIRMDAREPIIRTRATITARSMTLGKLMPKAELGKTAIGKVRADVAVTTLGNSIATMAGNANGDAEAGMGSGQVSKLLMEFASMDLTGILKIKLTHDRQIPIRCAYGDFAVKNGVMTPRALVFDTTELRLNGEGMIDLGDERLDLTFKATNKKFSPLSLRSPFYVRGTFKHPSVHPDYVRMGLRAAAAAVLANIAAPIAGLAATTELGHGKDAKYCTPQGG